MDTTRACKIDGWMSEFELAYLGTLAEKAQTIAEVGSWMGRSTTALAGNTPGKVYAVDTWMGSPEHRALPKHIDENYARSLNLGLLEGKDDDWLFNIFLKNVEGLPIEPVRMASVEAAKMFAEKGQTFDLIFIDANHDYENVSADILAWRPLLNPNGIICGHDFCRAWEGVIRAVTELVPKFKQIETIWTTEN